MTDTSREAVLIVKRDWSIAHASTPTSRVFGKSHAELLGQSIFSLMPERIRSDQEKLWASAPPAGECLRVDALGVRDDREFPLKVELARLPNAGEQLLCAILQCVPASSAEHRQSQKMEALGLLAGGVAHDFNNALTAIIGFAQGVKDELPADSDLAEDIQEVLLAAREASELTQQLLSFARQRPVEPAIVELNRTIREIENLLRRTLPASIELEVVPSEKELNVRLAPSELHQIIINLCTNARDAMPGGGKLRIAIGRGDPKDSQGPGTDHAIVEVSDTGAGIPAEIVTKIFDPFFSTKGEDGTGLGLSTCFGIAKQAGGNLAVASTVGDGTTFTLCIPTSQSGPVRLLTTTQKLDIKRHEGVALVVEDQPAIRKYVARILRRAGLETHVAGSAEEALTVTASLAEPPKLLVTDSMLPGKSGEELANALREIHPELRVVLTSGYLGPNSESDRVFKGEMVFLAKPFTATQLRRGIDTLLNPPRKLAGTILIVEPSEESAQTAQALLGDVDQEVVVLSSGKRALEYLNATDSPPSLMLLDTCLSDISAQELLDATRNIPTTSALPVILVESAVESEIIPRTSHTSRLCKPITRESLSTALAKVGLELH